MAVRTAISDEYFTWAVRQIRLGRRHHMPGIRRCTQCHDFYRTDDTGLPWCPDCRTTHDRICTHCGIRFDGDRYGTRLCPSCRDQIALF